MTDSTGSPPLPPSVERDPSTASLTVETSERRRRRARLYGLIALNLILWAAIALGVSIVASDVVDLGIESYVRQHQATAVARWQGFTARFTSIDADDPASVAASGPVSGSAPASGPVLGPAPADSGLATPQPSSPMAPEAAGLSAEPLPAGTPISRPLLLADPPLSDIQDLTAELERSAVGRPVQIRFQAEALNREIQALLREMPELSYRVARVDLKRDHVIVTGAISVLGAQLRATVAGRVVAEDCRPLAQAQSISIAGMTAPTYLREQLAVLLAESVDWYPPDYPLCIEQIVIEENRLTVYGYRR